MIRANCSKGQDAKLKNLKAQRGVLPMVVSCQNYFSFVYGGSFGIFIFKATTFKTVNFFWFYI